MALVWLHKKPGLTSEWTDNNKRVRTVPYEALFDDILTKPEVVEVVTGLPQLQDDYPGQAFTKVSKIRTSQQTESPWLWDIDIEYTTDLSLPKSLYLANSPFDRKAEISVNIETYTEAVDRAYDPSSGTYDVPIVNTSNEPFIPPLTVEKGRFVLTMNLHVASIDYIALAAFMYSINSATWYGFPAKTILVTDLSATPSYEAGYGGALAFHWILNAKVKYNKDNWNKKPLNIGKLMMILRDDLTIHYVPIRGDDQRPIQNPMPLTIDSDPIWPGSGLTFHYLEFQVYEKKDLNTIIPTSRLP
jgi:hypothetical protein